MLIILDEFQKFTLLLTGNCFSGNRIVDNHGCQLKSKRILADQIIINRHLKRRSQNTSDRVDGTVPSAIHLLKFDQPRLCIRQANLVNSLLSKRFFIQNVDHGLISRLGVMTDTRFQRSIFLYQFNYRVIAATGNDMVKQIRLNLLFLLSQRKLSLLIPGSRVILVQTPTVYILLLTILINISVTIPPICTLVFTFTQNPVSIVSSFFAHGISPFK